MTSPLQEYHVKGPFGASVAYGLDSSSVSLSTTNRVYRLKESSKDSSFVMFSAMHGVVGGVRSPVEVDAGSFGDALGLRSVQPQLGR